MKSLLIILLFMPIFAQKQQDCPEIKYKAILDKIERQYIKDKVVYSDTLNTYVYGVISINDFPFFCLDSSKNIPTFKAVWFCNDYASSIGRVEKDRVMIGMYNYTKRKKAPPKTKIYKLYFYKFNSDIKDWGEERPPMQATIEITNKDLLWYGCSNK